MKKGWEDDLTEFDHRINYLLGKSESSQHDHFVVNHSTYSCDEYANAFTDWEQCFSSIYWYQADQEHRSCQTIVE